MQIGVEIALYGIVDRSHQRMDLGTRILLVSPADFAGAVDIITNLAKLIIISLYLLDTGKIVL